MTTASDSDWFDDEGGPPWRPAPAAVVQTYLDATSPGWREMYWVGQSRAVNRAGDWWRARQRLQAGHTDDAHTTLIVSDGGDPANEVVVCLTCWWISRDLGAHHPRASVESRSLGEHEYYQLRSAHVHGDGGSPDALVWAVDEAEREDWPIQVPITLLRFTSEGLRGLCSWVCEGFDLPHIPGWVEPIVSRAQLQTMMIDCGTWWVEDHSKGVDIVLAPDGSSICELRPDSEGLFHLADFGIVFHAMDTGGPFFLHPDAETTWQASGFEHRVDSWAKPLVTHSVLLEILAASGWGFDDDAGMITVTHLEDEQTREVIEPGSDGLYQLQQLGWGFETVEQSSLEWVEWQRLTDLSARSVELFAVPDEDMFEIRFGDPNRESRRVTITAEGITSVCTQVHDPKAQQAVLKDLGFLPADDHHTVPWLHDSVADAREIAARAVAVVRTACSISDTGRTEIAGGGPSASVGEEFFDAIDYDWTDAAVWSAEQTEGEYTSVGDEGGEPPVLGNAEMAESPTPIQHFDDSQRG